MDCCLAGEGGQLDLVNSSRDNRPVDGPLVEIIVTKKIRNTFDVFKKTTIVSRLNGGQSTKTENLARDLKMI